MQTRSSPVAARGGILAAAGLAYFVVFPQDLSLLLSLVWQVLALSNAVSPWLYVVVGAAIVAWAIVRVWGRQPQADRDGAVSPP